MVLPVPWDSHSRGPGPLDKQVCPHVHGVGDPGALFVGLRGITHLHSPEHPGGDDLFIYDCAGSLLLCCCAGFSLGVLSGVGRGGSSPQSVGFSLLWPFLLSRGSRARVRMLWCSGLVALRHVDLPGPGIKPVGSDWDS